MKVMLVDDEAPARDRLRQLLSDMEDVVIVGEAADGAAALQAMEVQVPDVVLLDIRMPEMDGLEAARHLAHLTTPPAVIFTTAYDQFMLQAFDAHAIAYLMKPVRAEKLRDALARARRPNQAQRNALLGINEERGSRQHICARVRDELRIVPIEEVVYFRAESKYVTVRHLNGEVLIEESLKSLEAEFAENFVRIHRNALVPRSRIRGLDKDNQGHFHLKLLGCDESLEVSRRLVPEVRRLIRGG